MEGMSSGGVASNWYPAHYSNPPRNRRLRHTHILVTSTQHALRTLSVSLRLAKRPSAQFANSTNHKFSTNKVLRTRIYEQGSMNKVLRFKNALQASECYNPTSIQARVLVIQASIAAYLTRFAIDFFSLQFAQCKKTRKITTDKLCTWTTFQRVLNQEFFFGSGVAVFLRDPSCLKYTSLLYE
jgi:hypothetical protein